MTWTKLETGNDWGAVYLAPVGRARDRNGMCSARRAVKFDEGQLVKIRWPNCAAITEERVIHKKFHDTVGDHGHTYPVSYDLPGIMLSVHGAEAWAPLHKVGEVWLGDDACPAPAEHGRD